VSLDVVWEGVGGVWGGKGVWEIVWDCWGIWLSWALAIGFGILIRI